MLSSSLMPCFILTCSGLYGGSIITLFMMRIFSPCHRISSILKQITKLIYINIEASPDGSIGKASILLFRRLADSSPTQGGRLVADARDQQPLEPGEWGLESCSLSAFLREPPCGTSKKNQAGI